MYSDALRILDQNTVHYMIEELQAELSAEKAENEKLRRKLAQYEKQGKDTLDH